MGWTLSCNGLDLFKQSPNGRDMVSQWLGHCFVMGGTLSCNGLDFFFKKFIALILTIKTAPEKERICEVQQEIFEHAEGVLQGGSAYDGVYLCNLSYPSDQYGHDHRKGQVRVVGVGVYARSCKVAAQVDK